MEILVPKGIVGSHVGYSRISYWYHESNREVVLLVVHRVELLDSSSQLHSYGPITITFLVPCTLGIHKSLKK